MQIWVAAPNGSHARVLTVGDQPSVSPDGRYVAYVDDPNTMSTKVRVVPTAGGAPRLVGTASAAALTWAPNSRFLGIGDNDRLLTVIVDVESGKRLTTVPSVQVAFSPDSQRVAYAGDGLDVVSIRGGTPVRLGDAGDNPVWGKRGIAFFRHSGTIGGDVWMTGRRLNNERQLTHSGVGALPAAFSVDGTKLLAYYPPMHNGHLWAIDVRTGHARSITRWLDILPYGLSSSGATVLAIAGCEFSGGVLETIPFAGGKPHVIVPGTCSASWNAR
jgi:hypothetical protein